MCFFRKKSPAPPLVSDDNRTVFLVKHDKWMELHTAQHSISGWYVKLSESSYLLLLQGGGVIGTRSVCAWLPHQGWPPEVEDQFQKLKNSLANEQRV